MSTMRGVVQLGQAYNVSVVDLPMPTILNATDVIVKINISAICGSDPHFYHEPLGSWNPMALPEVSTVWAMRPSTRPDRLTRPS